MLAVESVPRHPEANSIDHIRIPPRRPQLNAPSESFLATLKKELVHRRTFRIRVEANLAMRPEPMLGTTDVASTPCSDTNHRSNRRTTTVTADKPRPHDRSARPNGGAPHTPGMSTSTSSPLRSTKTHGPEFGA